MLGLGKLWFGTVRYGIGTVGSGLLVVEWGLVW